MTILLLHNHIIELGDLGIFSLHLKSTASGSAEEVSRANIKGVRLAFQPSTLIRRKLEEAKFSK